MPSPQLYLHSERGRVADLHAAAVHTGFGSQLLDLQPVRSSLPGAFLFLLLSVFALFLELLHPSRVPWKKTAMGDFWGDIASHRVTRAMSLVRICVCVCVCVVYVKFVASAPHTGRVRNKSQAVGGDVCTLEAFSAVTSCSYKTLGN